MIILNYQVTLVTLICTLFTVCGYHAFAGKSDGLFEIHDLNRILDAFKCKDFDEILRNQELLMKNCRSVEPPKQEQLQGRTWRDNLVVLMATCIDGFDQILPRLAALVDKDDEQLVRQFADATISDHGRSGSRGPILKRETVDKFIESQANGDSSAEAAKLEASCERVARILDLVGLIESNTETDGLSYFESRFGDWKRQLATCRAYLSELSPGAIARLEQAKLMSDMMVPRPSWT